MLASILVGYEVHYGTHSSSYEDESLAVKMSKQQWAFPMGSFERRDPGK